MDPCVLGLVTYWPAWLTAGTVPKALVESDTDLGTSRAGRTGGCIFCGVVVGRTVGRSVLVISSCGELENKAELGLASTSEAESVVDVILSL
jgi:hypothetical protein